MSGELNAYVLLVLVGFLPNEVWRVLGLVIGRSIDEDSALFVLARAVATAVLAGVIAKIIVFAPGALAGVPLAIRLGAIACGFAAFLAVRRSVLAGVAVGEVVLILGSLVYGL
jgi:branched-subunit amino acid transport protein AzlD